MLSDFDEDTYSMIFASLKHPIRRRILRILCDEPQTFSNLQRMFNIESSHLTYHLDGLGNLLVKDENGKYMLSSLGEAAVSTMRHVEEPPKKDTVRLRFPSKNWKVLTVAMLIGLVLLSTLLVFQYQRLNELSVSYSSLSEEHKLLEEALKDGLFLGSAAFAKEHTLNGTIATALLQKIENFTLYYSYVTNETSYLPDDNGTIFIIWFSMTEPPLTDQNFTVQSITIFNVTTPWGHNIDTYSLFNLISNSTLNIKIAMNSSRSQTPLYISIDESWDLPNETVAGVPESYFHIWDREITENTTLSVPLASRKHYQLRVEVPGIWNATDQYAIRYTMTLSMESQGKTIPFIAKDRAEETSSYGDYEITMTDGKPMLLSNLPFFMNFQTNVVP